MALLDLTKAVRSVDMTDPNLVSFGTFENGDATTWSFLSTGNDDIELKGSNLTYDATGRALTGKVNSISIDVENDDPNAPDIAIIGIDAAATLLDNGPGGFWRFLEGDDTIIGPGAGVAGAAEFFKLFGDGLAARVGSTLGGNDSIQPGQIQAEVTGDVVTVGSQAAGTRQSTYSGGDDEISSLVRDKFQELAGDARTVNATGSLFGGNDKIVISSAFGIAIGDALTVEGVFGDRADVFGGNDIITAADNSHAQLVGDVSIMRANSFVRGGNDTIAGGIHAEEIIGDASLVGDNRLIGGADRLTAGDGDDVVSGDFSVASPGSVVTGGNDTISGGNGDDVIYGEGAKGAESAAGGNDLIFGDDGFDSISGQSGNDTLDGGNHIDTLIGGAGNDTYIVERQADSVIENTGEGIDTIQTTSIGMTLAANVENLVFVGATEFFGKGNALANRIASLDGNDVLEGLEGNDAISAGGGTDTLVGGSGNDTLEGGAGQDSHDGGAGFDFASYLGAMQAVKVSLDSSVASAGDAIGDSFTAVEGLSGSNFSDELYGDGAANALFGNAGDDSFQGAGGRDTIDGGAGGDTLMGGAGNDRFRFTALNHGVDRIADFTNAVGNNDILAFEGDAFGNLPAGALAANRFIANASGEATTLAQRFVYETDTGVLRFDANGSAAGGVTTIAVLTGSPVLGLGDFLII